MISNREHQYRKVNAQLLMIDVGGQWRPCEMWHLHIIQCLVPYKSFKLEMITVTSILECFEQTET